MLEAGRHLIGSGTIFRRFLKVVSWEKFSLGHRHSSCLETSKIKR